MLSQGRQPVASIQRYKQEAKKQRTKEKRSARGLVPNSPILFRSIPNAYHEQLKDQQTSVLRIAMMRGFSPASPTRIFWNSRKRSATVRSLEESLKSPVVDRRVVEPAGKTVEAAPPTETAGSGEANPEEDQGGAKPELSERRRALFEPLEPTGGRTPAELLLPPPDFDTASYPKGWLVGKKRKLVNVDVVESMRRIAVQEMNRKDKEINGLNEQLEEDARCLEHLQLQLLDERSKRAEAERQNVMLQDQISMLMNMLEATDAIEDDTSAHHH